MAEDPPTCPAPPSAARTLDYAPPPRFWALKCFTRRDWALVWLAMGAILHFAVAVVLWAMFLGGPRRQPIEYYREYVLPTLGPCLVLFLLACICLWMALTRRRTTGRCLSILAVLAGLLFWYDTVHQRWQLEVGIATYDYWRSGGREHYYLNWPWYNDRWFKHPKERSASP